MSHTMNSNTGRSVGRFSLAVESEKAARLLGNRLRQVLLDETEGMAATCVRIDGVIHEFQAVPGALEDTLDVIQNLKKVRVRASNASVKAVLDSARAEVKAGDLKLESGEVANPDLVLAHLSPGVKLMMEVIFERGRGYRVSERAPEGFLPIEPDFCPVRKAAVHPKPDRLEVFIETDSSISPEAALSQALRELGEIRGYETLPVEPRERPRSVDLGPGFAQDPFMGFEPPSAIEVVKESYNEFLDNGIPKLLDMIFPLTSRTLGSEDEPAARSKRERRLDLIGYRLEMPDVTPAQCMEEGRTYEARLVLSIRLRRSARDGVYGADNPAALEEQEVDMGPIPLMTEDGGFVIGGARRVCIMLVDENLRVQRVADLVMRELSEIVTRMKPVLEDRITTSGWLSSDIMKLLPLSATLLDLLSSADWCQYSDDTNPLAGLTHKRRLRLSKGEGAELSDELRMLRTDHFGRVDYLETPEGPNIGLIHTLCPYAKVGGDGEVLTPYRVAKEGYVTEEMRYLSADEEKEYLIADATAAGSNRKLRGEDVLVREGDDIRWVPAQEVQLVSVSPIQSLSFGSALIPFLGHNDPNRALMASNMQRQAVPLIRSEQPLVKTGVEARAARDTGLLVIARRGGNVIEASNDRIVVLAGSEIDIYELVKFRRSNQATCINHRPVVTVGQTVSEGQVLADAAGTSGGELALGRNVLAAYMPFRGYNFEDAICISDELVRTDAFTSVHLEKYEVEVGGADVWVAPEGARVNLGDVLVQESAGRKRTFLVAPPYNPAVVARSWRKDGKVKIVLAEKRNARIGDKFAGRHGNKGVIAKVLPRSQMPYLEDGTPVQMVLNTLGVWSRMNVGQILETHYGALAHALGAQIVIPPFMTPSDELLKSKLKEAGLSETGMVILFDGATGRPFESPVTVGYLYMMKLAHLVDDKIHAISTGEPSVLTHQPAYGGQRLGFLEMWALESYKAACTLQESLTIKSDDAEGRERAALALLAGEEVEPYGEGRSLELLENALRSLGIRVEEER